VLPNAYLLSGKKKVTGNARKRAKFKVFTKQFTNFQSQHLFGIFGIKMKLKMMTK
jgi:hypothetical protein